MRTLFLVGLCALAAAGCTLSPATVKSQPDCPSGTQPCGYGCVADGATCCNAADHSDDDAGTFVCAGSGVCARNRSGSCGDSRYCCSATTTFGSVDCTGGELTCGLECTDAGNLCCSPSDTGDCVVLGGTSTASFGSDTTRCPSGTLACGRGCLAPSATCCNSTPQDDALGTFECVTHPAATQCTRAGGTGCGGSRYCCSSSGSFGSLDCTGGSLVCNLNCVSLGATCRSLLPPFDVGSVGGLPVQVGGGGSSVDGTWTGSYSVGTDWTEGCCSVVPPNQGRLTMRLGQQFGGAITGTATLDGLECIRATTYDPELACVKCQVGTAPSTSGPLTEGFIGLNGADTFHIHMELSGNNGCEGAGIGFLNFDGTIHGGAITHGQISVDRDGTFSLTKQ